MTAESREPRLTGLSEGETGRLRGLFRKKISGTADRQKRLRIVRSYARIEPGLSEGILIETLDDSCEIIRDFIVRELSSRPEVRLDLLCGRLASPPWYARSAVLRILAARKPGQAVPFIGRVLEDANADVRKCAAQALGEIGGRAALPLLIRLQKDSNPYVRAAADEGLRKASEVRFS